MDVITAELLKFLVPVVAAALLGLLKYLGPRVRERVPNVFWPFAVFGLARAGTALCRATGTECSGNPFAWDEATVQAMAAAFLAIAIREGAKHAGDVPALWKKLRALVDKKPPS